MIHIIKTIYGAMNKPQAFRFSKFDLAYLAALSKKLGQSQINVILTGLYAIEQNPRERARILAEREVYEKDIRQSRRIKATDENKEDPGASAVRREARRVK